MILILLPLFKTYWGKLCKYYYKCILRDVETSLRILVNCSRMRITFHSWQAIWSDDTQHNDTQHNDTQHYDTQRNDT
jgi:hypothetical protein